MAPDDPALLRLLERYYDEVPRSSATTEDLGPFTLFVRASADGWPFYARPRWGDESAFTADDVRRVRERQLELGVPEAFEWVHENHPELTAVVRSSGLHVAEHPLMVLGTLDVAAAPKGVRVEVLDPEHEALPGVLAAVSAGFGDTDELEEPGHLEHQRAMLADGSYRLVGAFVGEQPVGGGSHAPRGAVTELTGIAVLPRARSRGVGAAITATLVEDARRCGASTVFLSAGSRRVADIYARVGFERVGTACVAEA